MGSETFLKFIHINHIQGGQNHSTSLVPILLQLSDSLSDVIFVISTVADV